MQRALLIALACLFVSTVYAEELAKPTISTSFEKGELILETFLDACSAFSEAIPANRIHKEALGKVINYNGSLYEIRVESFEDPDGILSPLMTFREYARQNNLLQMRSCQIRPLPTICFECFDFRHAQLNDGVYFTVVLRKLNDGVSD